jgi:hypothetical protein
MNGHDNGKWHAAATHYKVMQLLRRYATAGFILESVLA